MKQSFSAAVFTEHSCTGGVIDLRGYFHGEKSSQNWTSTF